MRRKVVWLDSRRAKNRNLVGGKASNLARLVALGFPVPRGFAVPVRYPQGGEPVLGDGCPAEPFVGFAARWRFDHPWWEKTIRSGPLPANWIRSWVWRVTRPSWPPSGRSRPPPVRPSASPIRRTAPHPDPGRGLR